MPTLPSGTVTFLFTDIEGSTKLARAYPETWETACGRQEAILRGATESNSGFVFKIIGDSICAAFSKAGDALKAALTGQHDLQREPWGDAVIRARMGIHTGEAETDGKDYRGYITLSLVQRVMSAGHGGQILLSGVTEHLLRDQLPKDVTLRDLGEHRLKDAPLPVRIFQVLAPDLPSDFPALRALDVLPNNLPTQLTSFIGREKEIGGVKRHLEKNRLVTLTGSGGAGKTRLSLQVAADLLSQFPNGVWFVELAPITDPDLIPQTILTAAEIQTQQGRSSLDSLTDFLREKTSLLVLDNCEHLIEACAKLAETLLSAAPNLRILASSREALGVKGEQTWHVPSLSVPDLKNLPPTEGFSQYEAVRLFIDRALLVQPYFSVTNDNAPAVAQICYQLDGIPLAIELAAARLRILSAEQIASRLDDRLRLLTGGSRTALPRQQTLRASIDWSYNLLSDEERTLLRQLSVFTGGWTLEAAEAVCGNADILDPMTRLIDKSLVAVDREHGDEPRYYLLETVRQYAREKLSESGEAHAIRAQHLAYFLDLAQRAEPEVQGAEQLLWLDRLEADLDNIRAVLEWSLEGAEQAAETGLQLASHLWWFWFIRGYTDGGEWLEKALQASQASTDLVSRAKALSRLAWVRFFDAAHAEEGLALGRTLGLAGRESVAQALLGKSAWALYQADYARAKAWAGESLELFREIGHRFGICEALTWLGMALISLGDHPQAKARLEESLALARKARDGNEIGFAVWQLGRAAMFQGDYEQATGLLEEALAINRELKLSGGVAFVLSDLGKAALLKGDYQQAGSCYKEVLALYWKLGSERNIAFSLEQLASVAVVQSQSEQAAKLFGAAERLREASGAALFPYQIADYEQSLESLRSQLDEAALAAHWAKGRTMSLKQAIEYAFKEAE